MKKIDAKEIKARMKTDEWTKKIVACRNSGIPATRWCAENNIPYRTYSRWENKILTQLTETENATTADESRLNLSLPAAVQISQEREKDKWPVEVSIRVGAARIDVYTGAEAEVIEAVCSAARTFLDSS